ncbi:MAG: hypothetical protein DHS20C11_05770 [Lysobacteraceae bacterium]|nr:MAG: hypothetical protein DHS20C11_05770 [Xanthomonadaceae bacterium]
MALTRILIAFVGLLGLMTAVAAQEQPRNDDSDMTAERIHALVERIDAEAQRQENFWQFSLKERIVMIVIDTEADRMRIISPIVKNEDVPIEIYTRMLQANFDSALDARYAIANEIIWGAYIHPLRSLTDEELLSGIAQVVTVADTFGTTYSSGALIYGGGDSNEEIDKLYQELMDLLNPVI